MVFDPLSAGINLGKEVVSLIKGWFPEKMTEQQEAAVVQTVNSNFRNFMLAYEGSINDYSKFPVVGSFIVLIRGAIRPVLTIADGYWLWTYFMSSEPWPELKVKLLAAISILILFFWFGERAVKYVLPLLIQYFGLKKGDLNL